MGQNRATLAAFNDLYSAAALRQSQRMLAGDLNPKASLSHRLNAQLRVLKSLVGIIGVNLGQIPLPIAMVARQKLIRRCLAALKALLQRV